MSARDRNPPTLVTRYAGSGLHVPPHTHASRTPSSRNCSDIWPPSPPQSSRNRAVAVSAAAFPWLPSFRRRPAAAPPLNPRRRCVTALRPPTYGGVRRHASIHRAEARGRRHHRSTLPLPPWVCCVVSAKRRRPNVVHVRRAFLSFRRECPTRVSSPSAVAISARYRRYGSGKLYVNRSQKHRSAKFCSLDDKPPKAPYVYVIMREWFFIFDFRRSL